MFEFLGRGKHKADKSAAGDPGPSTQFQTVQLSATQIEVVRMTLHGVLKLHGIPGTWITGEVMPVHIPGQGNGVLLQLEVRHWHDALVLHAPALERAVLDGLKRFDPQAAQTRYLFAWKFSAQSGCPHIHLPEPDFWTTSERVVLAPIAAPSPQTVAARAPSTAHINLPHDGDDPDDDHGFAPTQIRDTP
jgi:hypothetical protein